MEDDRELTDYEERLRMSAQHDKYAGSVASGFGAAEIVVPHAAEIQPVTAVKYLVMHSSLAHLERAGYLERYVELVDRRVLEQLRAGLAAQWAPAPLAEAHYEACDNMRLSDTELAAMGQNVGDRLRETSLVLANKNQPDLWGSTGAFHRIWARHYRGGSVELTKLGPKSMGMELRGFGVCRFRYYRVGLLAVLDAFFTAMNVPLQAKRILSYDSNSHELRVNLVAR